MSCLGSSAIVQSFEDACPQLRKIVAVTVDNEFLMKWKNIEEYSLVPASTAKDIYPQLVAKLYEGGPAWNMFPPLEYDSDGDEDSDDVLDTEDSSDVEIHSDVEVHSDVEIHSDTEDDEEDEDIWSMEVCFQLLRSVY